MLSHLRTRFPSKSDGLAFVLDIFLTSSPDSRRAPQLYSLGNTDHVVLYIVISFRSPMRQEPRINRTSFCYQRTDWESFRDLLRDAPWNDVLNHPVETYVTELSLRVKASIDAFYASTEILQSSWFSSAS